MGRSGDEGKKKTKKKNDGDDESIIIQRAAATTKVNQEEQQQQQQQQQVDGREKHKKRKLKQMEHEWDVTDYIDKVDPRTTGPIIGIDLGTSNSVVAVLRPGDNRVHVIADAAGATLQPSVVAFLGDSQEGGGGRGESRTLVGVEARRQSIANAENTVTAVKRLIGRRIDDPAVRQEAPLLAYDTVADEDGHVLLRLGNGTVVSPVDVSAIILKRMKQMAEAFLGEPVHDCIITVPAYFLQAQRDATSSAGKRAGLNVIKIINEPTAAALAYGLVASPFAANPPSSLPSSSASPNVASLEKKPEGERIAVYDLGGGTFDFSVLELYGNSDDAVGLGSVSVLGTSGDSHLGGEDFDALLMMEMIGEFHRRYNINLMADKKALQRLREKAEEVKLQLDHVDEVEVLLPFLHTDATAKVYNFQTKVRRRDYEYLVKDLIEKTFPPCEVALKDAQTTTAQLKHVLLVGGMSRMPKVVEEVEKRFGRGKVYRGGGVSADEANAVGAAMMGAVMSGKVQVLLLEWTNCRVMSSKKTFETEKMLGKDMHSIINDYIVAITDDSPPSSPSAKNSG